MPGRMRISRGIWSAMQGIFSHGLDREGWKRHKSELNQRYGQTRVTISNLEIRLLSPERATVYFDQVYSSDKYHDNGKKTIRLIRGNGDGKSRERYGPR